MLTAVETKPVERWLCRDTVAELRGDTPRTLPVRPRPAGVALTWSDFFCGAGGSSSGIEAVPGAGVRMAVNHWGLAIDTHNHNMPWVDHDRANVARTDPRRYAGTDLAWFSPECTQWSIAKGEKCDYDKSYEQPTLFGDDDEEPAAKEAKWRSRMLMRDVVRFARHHRYRAVIVENVPDILKWSQFDRWLAEMHAEGYRHKVVTLNSAFAQALGAPAPQLRDRVYVVFWLAKYATPNWDKWLRPKGWCPRCQSVVVAVYAPKPGPRRPMRYGPHAQYVYRCPQARCRGAVVQPYVLPALAAIDLTLPAVRIGDRPRPLATATRDRIIAALRRYTRPLLVPTGGTHRDLAVTADRPMATRTTTENDAVVVPPFLTVLRSGRPRTVDLGDPFATFVADGSGHALVEPLVVPLESRDGQRARSAGEPLRAQTARHQDALVVPLRRHGVATPAETNPLVTLAAAGTHHALVMRNNTARGDDGQMSTPVEEPLRTLLAEGPRQSLIQWDHLLYQYDSGDLRPLAEPMPTQTTVEGDALVGVMVDVDDCTLRMLAVKEIQAGMAFASSFVLLGTAKRDNVRMLGNAVTPPAARDLAACVMEAITGDPIDRSGLATTTGEVA